MSFPRRDNQITFGAVLAWLLVIVFTVVVLFLLFKPKDGDQPTAEREGWSAERLEGSGLDQVKAPFDRIAGLEWLLIELTTEGESYELSDEVGSTFRCEANGRFNGNAGCNNYFGQFMEEAGGKGLKTGPIGSTMMACPSPKAEQEHAFLVALEQTSRVETHNHQLRLSNADDSTVMIFALIIPDDLGEAEGASGEIGAGAGVGAGVGAGAGAGADSGEGTGGATGARGTVGVGGAVGAGAAVGAGGAAGAGGASGGDGGEAGSADQGNIDIDAQSAPGGKAAMASIIYRGQLQLQDKQFIFAPCESNFTVHLEAAGFEADLAADEIKLDLESGVYAEFRADLRAHDEDGARLQLRDPLFMANEGGSCEHPTQVASLVASGNEPFWTLIAGETHSTLRTPKGEWRLEGGMHPNDAFFSAPRGSRSITLVDQAQDIEISAQFHKDPCHDSMVDAWSTYSVEIEYNGTKGKGCGRPGRWLPPMMGRYRAEMASASSPGRTITLMLGDGGLVTLSHDNQNDEPAVRQQGLWQLRNRGTIEIQFMTQDGKPSHERMVLAGDGNTLTAVEFGAQRWGSEGLHVARIAEEGK